MKNTITKDDSVSSDEIQTYFNENQSKFDFPEFRTIRRLRVPSSDIGKIDQISKTITSDNFSLVTKQFSDDVFKEAGGLTDPQNYEGFEDELGPSLTKDIFKTDVGKISGPIVDGDWTYWIKVEDITPPKKAKLEDVSEKIKKLLLQEKQQKTMIRWLNDQKSSMYFEIRDSNLQRSRLNAFFYDLLH